MYVNVTIFMSLCMTFLKNVHFIEFFSRNRTVFKHRSHCGIAVNISIFTLNITVFGRIESKFIKNTHKVCFHFSGTGTLISVKNVCFGSFGMSVFNKDFFNYILNFLNCRNFITILFFVKFTSFYSNIHCLVKITSAA